MSDTTTTEQHPPTAEQQAAIDLYHLGDNLVIEAGAGTGKSTTLKMMARANPLASVQYTAFNKAIVTDVGADLPLNAAANTAHSLAYGAVMRGNRDLVDRLRGGRMRAGQVARLLGVMPIVVKVDGLATKVLQPDYLASLAQRTVNNFCASADPAPDRRHVPYVDGIDMPDAMGRRTYANNDRLRDELAGYVAAVWADVQNPSGRLPFSHQHYLKIWERRDPIIQADVIMFDEAQDASPVMLSIVEQQRSAQLVFVGDANQAIYEFTGAVDAITNAPVDRRTFLTQSFRFGPEIAALAILGRLPTQLRLQGLDSIPSRVAQIAGRPDAILTRTNSGAMETVLQLQASGVSAHLVGGSDQIASFARAAQDLMDRGFTRHQDLACFTSWAEVVAYVENDPQGDELKLMVKIVDEYGVDVILQALDSTVPESRAEVVVSTAHKAKGREWDRVQLHSDFPEVVDEPSEWRLAYVAATRARLVLDPFAAAAIRSLIAPATVG